MRTGKIAFERVSLAAIRRLLEEQNNGKETSVELTLSDKPSNRVARKQSPSPRNLQKHRARPKRSMRREGEDYPRGLWIDEEIFLKHQSRPPQVALREPMLNSSDHHVALPDSVLTDKKSKPKSEVNEKASRATA